MVEDKYGFVTPCDNCILKVEHNAINKRLMEMTKELKLKEMRIKEQHDRIKELEDACDDEAERCAKTNDARIAAVEEAMKWRREYSDLFLRIMNHNNEKSVPGITTTPVFDPEYYTPGKLLKVERFYANEKLAETVNVVIMGLDRQNTRLICRTMDKDNEEVFITVNKVLDGTKNGIVLTPIKVVEEDTQ